ncbi:MAG: hypothetical protein IJF65_04635 [Clostridia bacterium]|nr:hypothetical protein [Clostridia bacterium]
MNDLETVMACRTHLEGIRQRAEEMEIMQKSLQMVPEAAGEMAQIIDHCQKALDEMRREFPGLVSRSTLILKRLPYKERRVLMLYYVSGATLREVAQTLKCGIRTVQKLKKAGLDRLR